MEFPQIRLSSERAYLGIRVERGHQSIEQPKAELHIQQPKADMSIKQLPGKLTIDQTNAWQNLGLKSSRVRTEETADHAKRTVLEGTARMAEEGDELMRIENGGEPLADQAARNAIWQFDYPLDGMPVYDLVSIDYQANEPEISFTKNEPVIEAVPQKVRYDYQPRKVEVFMQKYGALDIDFVNLKYKGYRFETEI
ncbi:hypothetical protein GCM10007216_11970 [Thalassobacillus devorans]|uniref:Uncharacterized protein n=1 Tax=Thalassobacillus devorans TaxID=279813 RepID=A0ABQ1NQM2_9BACI|nr:DUF6470 family protein [Thalassobacillus devorans]NIK28863.1 hypothetical protein [Thalassobacillus devorans]GGC83003.1 hypothetical protein GCM10007216_11970 [Thalassobacillus devorans]